MEIDTNGFELGDLVRDKVTDLQGTITAFSIFMTGCARASVQPKANNDGKVPDPIGQDVTMLELIQGKVVESAPPIRPAAGGPQPVITSGR